MTSGRLTPSERDSLRALQRHTRLSWNRLKAAVSDWKMRIAEGKIAASSAAQSLLQQRYFPVQPLGVLSDLKGLREAAATKLYSQTVAAVGRMTSVVVKLCSIAEDIGDCAQAFSSLKVDHSNLDLYTQPIFASLSWSTLEQWMSQMAAAYASEASVKTAVANALQALADDASTWGGTTPSLAEDQAIRNQLEVLLTAWTLPCELDDEDVSEHLVLMAEDMRGS